MSLGKKRGNACIHQLPYGTCSISKLGWSKVLMYSRVIQYTKLNTQGRVTFVPKQSSYTSCHRKWSFLLKLGSIIATALDLAGRGTCTATAYFAGKKSCIKFRVHWSLCDQACPAYQRVTSLMTKTAYSHAQPHTEALTCVLGKQPSPEGCGLCRKITIYM